MITSPKKNINHIDLTGSVSVGNTRRREILNMPVEKTAMLPKSVVYKDIDDAFKEWAKSLKIVSEDGAEYPTMTLYSNQRFSEYSQSWQYTDDNKQLLLNFKTVTRENNPQYGKIQSGLWNIPGDRFYQIKRMKVLDENGTESLIDLSMRQPMAVDLLYKLSIFTNKYESLNDFNIMVNKKFRARQCYLAPNGYYMPMVLENVSDESEYSIDDRQFYSQTYQIKLMGYVIEDEDLRVTEIPLKRSVRFSILKSDRKKPDVTIDDEEGEENDESIVSLTITFPELVNSAEFDMDEDMVIDRYEYDNVVRKFRLFVNDDEIDGRDSVLLRNGDSVKVIIKHRNIRKEAILKFIGHNPREDRPEYDIITGEEVDYDNPFPDIVP